MQLKLWAEGHSMRGRSRRDQRDDDAASDDDNDQAFDYNTVEQSDF